MTTIRPFVAEDLFKFNHINLDPLTETYNIPFYTQYLATWPGLCASFEDPNGRMMGYILGKAEGQGKLWHGHVTAVTVSPEFRRLGVAKHLMAYLEEVSEDLYNGYFVDLFVRASNKLAQMMYANLGYTVYRTVLGYYSGEEDAYGTWVIVCVAQRGFRHTFHLLLPHRGRHAESVEAGREKGVRGPADQTHHPGRVRMVTERNHPRSVLYMALSVNTCAYAASYHLIMKF